MPLVVQQQAEMLLLVTKTLQLEAEMLALLTLEVARQQSSLVIHLQGHLILPILSPVGPDPQSLRCAVPTGQAA